MNPFIIRECNGRVKNNAYIKGGYVDVVLITLREVCIREVSDAVIENIRRYFDLKRDSI